jgi:hypothetical protein
MGSVGGAKTLEISRSASEGDIGAFSGSSCALNIVAQRTMHGFPPPVPPELSIATSWRDLWRSGVFAQLDLTSASNFATGAKEFP